MLVDVFSKGITGKVAEAALGKAGITVNKNAIPFDQNPPMVASGIRIGTPAVTTRGMREAEMDSIGELIARALTTPDDDAALGDGQGRSRDTVPEVPAVSGRQGLTPLARARRRRVRARTARWRGRCPTSNRAPARPRWPRPSRAPSTRAACCSPRPAPAPARRSPTSSRPSSAASACSSRPARRTSRNRSSSRTFRRCGDALGVPFTATYMKGRAQLPVPAPLRSAPASGADERPRLAAVRRSARRRRVPADHPTSGPDATDTGDRAELEDLPEDLPFWSEVSATAETCLGTECPRYDDCFVTRMRQRAAESDVVIVNHHLLCADAAVRQSAFGEVIPACATPSSTRRTSSRTSPRSTSAFSVSNYRLEDLRARRRTAVGDRGAVERAERPRRAREGDRPAARRTRATFFTELAFAHRTERPRARRRARARDRRRRSATAPRRRRAISPARSTCVEATLALLPARPATCRRARASRRRTQAGDRPTGRRVAGPAGRRAARRAPVPAARRTIPTYVYFVEFRGKGVFLRASPIDVSTIVRELLLDRMRTTVLTSATLTVDGTLRLHPRPARHRASADEIRLPSEFDYARAGDPVPAAADARPAVARVSRRRPAGRSSRSSKRTQRPGVRAVHELRGAARRAGHRRDGARLPDPRAGHGAARRSCSSSSARRRTRCCWPRRASGRAWTSSARR